MDTEATRRAAIVVTRAAIAVAVLHLVSGITLATEFHDGFRGTVAVIASRSGTAAALPLLVGACAVAFHDAGQRTRSSEAAWIRLFALVTGAVHLTLAGVLLTTDDASFVMAPTELRFASILADALAPAVLAATAFAVARHPARTAPQPEPQPGSEDERWDALDPI